MVVFVWCFTVKLVNSKWGDGESSHGRHEVHVAYISSKEKLMALT